MESVVDGHSSCRSVCKNKNPAGAGFCLNSVKLTGKPPSVYGKHRGRSFVLTFCLKNKTPPEQGFVLNSVKLTDKPLSVYGKRRGRSFVLPFRLQKQKPRRSRVLF
ncbi:hypothetical protein, partial [Erwinia amylovora]|uniref:hypothetical protein n=2 Tax=Erwinia amylovora TaxID=552 RepID=UPI0020BFD561